MLWLLLAIWLTAWIRNEDNRVHSKPRILVHAVEEEQYLRQHHMPPPTRSINNNPFEQDTRKHCPVRCLDPSAEFDDSRHEQPTLRIFYLVLLHSEQSFEDAVHLFRAIRHERNTIYIHVDRKAEHLVSSTDLQLQTEIELCPCGSHVHMESVHNVEWSKWSMVLPTLWGMQQAVRLLKSTNISNYWDVFINLSGDNLPVYTADSTARLLQELPYNFVTSSSCATGLVPTSVYEFPDWWHKRAHYMNRGTEADPEFTYSQPTASGSRTTTTTNVTKTVTTHFGSQWIILQRNMVEHLVDALNDPDSLASQLARYYQKSGKLMTDETFIPTYMMHISDRGDDDNLVQFPPRVNVTDEPSNNNILETGIMRRHASERLLWRNQTASSIRHVRFERMDEHVPTAFGHLWNNQRYEVPEQDDSDGDARRNRKIAVPRPWGPYYLGVYDLGAIIESGALFIRKVSQYVDPNLLTLLPVEDPSEIPRIAWPTASSLVELELSARPDWNAFLRRFPPPAPTSSSSPKRQSSASSSDGEDEDPDL